MSTARAGARRLASASITYGLGSVLTRGMTFLLLPLYTRSLSTTDYGIVAVAGTVTSILGMVLPLGLHGAVARFHYAAGSDAERRVVNGTLWLAVLVSALALAGLVNAFGAPLAASLIPQVPFDPFVRLAVWTSFFTALGLVPLAILQVQERPRLYVLLAGGASLATTMAVIVFAVLRRGGARGYLVGALVGAIVAAIAYLAVALRSVTPALDLATLRASLLYSLPLVPHSLASWVLELSDRAVLSRYVPLADVGVYGIGYQLGAALGLLTAAFNAAWVPVLFRGLSKASAEADRELARLATYYAMALAFCALGWGLFAQPATALFLAPAYSKAYQVTLWVVAAYVLSGLYVLPINLLFWKQTTGFVPVVTVAAGLCNAGLNFWLIPRHGFIAAAWSTFVGYAVMLVLAWAIARRHRPFPYEYRRIMLTLAAAGALFALGSGLGSGVTMPGMAVRLMAWLALPPVLAVLGVLHPAEITKLRALLRPSPPPPAEQGPTATP